MAQKTDTIRWASGLNVVAGIWLIISPFLFGSVWATAGSIWNSLFVGVVVVVLAAMRASGSYSSPWMSWLNALLGVWIFFSPWIYAYAWNEPRAWNSVITGGAIVVLGLISGFAGRSEGRPVYRTSAPSRI